MNERLYQSILDNLPIGVSFAVPDTSSKEVDNFHSLLANKRAHDWELGQMMYRQSDPTSQTSTETALNNLRDAYKRAWQTSKEVEVLSSMCRRTTVKVLKQGEEKLGLLTVTTQLSPNQPQVQRQKQLTEKKEEQGRSKCFFAYLSHEIRTPMNGLIGTVSLLAEDEQLTALQREFVETINSSALHLLMLINDALDYSKLCLSGDGSQKLKITKTTINICSIVYECVSAYVSQARDGGLDFIVRIAPALVKQPFCFGDPLRIKQVLANLVSNAVKFTKKGFVLVDVSLSHSEDLYRSKKRNIVFRVIDTGLGVKPEDRDNIFLPYMQEDSSETKCFSGTGLGLPIARKIAELLGGSLELESSQRSDPPRPIYSHDHLIVPVRSEPMPSTGLHPLYPSPQSVYRDFHRHSGSTFAFHLAMKADISASLSWESPSLHVSQPSECSTPQESLRKIISSPAPMCILLVGLPELLATTVSELFREFGARCKTVDLREGKKLLSKPGCYKHWDVVAIFKGQDDSYLELARRIRRSESIQNSEKVMLLLFAYTPDQVDTTDLDENSWNAYFGLPLQPMLMLKMMARLGEMINKSRENMVLHIEGEQELKKIKEEWKMKKKSELPSRWGLRFLHRNKNSDSIRQRTERLVFLSEKKEQSSMKMRILTKYSFLPKKLKVTSECKWNELTALVVDDNTINRKVAIHMLERMGFRRSKIDLAEDGEEALRKAREKKFDLILMDCFMPRLSGWEASRKLRAEGHRGVIIATTGVASSAEVAECYACGMQDCLQKPLVLDAFRDSLSNAFQSTYGSFSKEDLSQQHDASTSGGPFPLPTSASAPSALSLPTRNKKERNSSL